MKTFQAGLLALVLLLGCAGRSQGLLGIKGMRGTFRTISGDAEDRGNLALSLWFDYWRKIPDTTEQREMNLSMAASSTPRPSLELYGIIGVRGAENTQATGMQSITGFTDAELGMKLVRLSDSWLRPSVCLSISLPTGEDDFSPGGTRLGALGAVTLDFKNLKGFIPLRVNANVGYSHIGGDSYRLPLGISLELPSRYFTPVVEFSSEQCPGDTLSFGESPLRFTQGVKATPFRWLSLGMGYDVNLSKETERYIKSEGFDWRLFFGATVARSLSGLGPQPGVVYGTVLDKETGEPVAARLTVRGSEDFAETDPLDGIYRMELQSEGLVSLVVEARGYKKRVVPAVVVQGKNVERNIELVGAERSSRLSASVTDRITNEPISCMLRFEGRKVLEVSIDSSGSQERHEIPSGDYSVVCDAPGYMRVLRDVTFLPEKEERLSLMLLKYGESLVVAGVSFESGTANLRVESDSGIREVVELLESNPKTKFEIGGHTDDSGPQDASLSLSEKRASVFARFLVKGYELDQDRLVAKGYGREKPIADNETEEGRRRNNRIEIKALGPGE